jgi:hypothetical protein
MCVIVKISRQLFEQYGELKKNADMSLLSLSGYWSLLRYVLKDKQSMFELPHHTLSRMGQEWILGFQSD